MKLQRLLEELAAEHNVPGASVAVLGGEEVTLAATGVTSTRTRVEVTSDTIFQIGSITKVFTATQVMQLVDEGRVELDAPVRTYLPELQLSDPRATATVTVRQLLAHTSGIDGDYFPDFGRGDDCVARFVAGVSGVPQIATPGRMFSYSNTGYVLLGALVAALAGTTWDAALKERLLAPLGARSVTLPEEAILHRAAVGHLESGPTPVWMLPRAAGRGGIIATAADVLSFARMHLDGGVGADGTRVLSEQSVRTMQERQVELPDRSLGTACGLGWILYDWGGRRLIGHDGDTIGQFAFLRIVPDARFAVVLLTNGLTGPALHRSLFKRLLAEGAGVTMPEPPRPVEGVEGDLERFVGTYERLSMCTRIELREGELVASLELDGILREIEAPAPPAPLRRVDPTTFLLESRPVVFLDPDESGRPRYLHSGGRASVRVG